MQLSTAAKQLPVNAVQVAAGAPGAEPAVRDVHLLQAQELCHLRHLLPALAGDQCRAQGLTIISALRESEHEVVCGHNVFIRAPAWGVVPCPAIILSLFKQAD